MPDASRYDTRPGNATALEHQAPTVPDEPRESGSLFRDHAFRNVFCAAAVSASGTQVSFVAMPLVAVTVLNATPSQVGLIGVLKTIAFLLIGLPAGAWLDRMRQRRVMVAADLVRALLLASVPLGWWLDVLSVGQLYFVVLFAGVATVFFDVAALSYLPSVVGRARLVDANSKLQSWEAVVGIAGPSVAGVLVQFTAAPTAITIDAVSFLWSALFLCRARRHEDQPQRVTEPRFLNDILEGIKFVFGHPLLRPIAVVGASTNLFVQIAIVTMPLLFQRVLHLSPGVLGLFFTFGGAGIFLGSFTAKRLTEQLGHGRALWAVGLAATPFGCLVPFVDRGAWQWIAMFSWLVLMYRIGMNNVILVSVRQKATPDRLLNRMNATMRFLLTGVLAVGAALAGLIGQYAGPRTALWVAAVGLSLGWIPIIFSPRAEPGSS